MADTRAAQLRRLWLNVHLWIALSLVALLVPISISGGLLVWHDEIDSVINPKRYAVSGQASRAAAVRVSGKGRSGGRRRSSETARHSGAVSRTGLARARRHARTTSRRRARPQLLTAYRRSANGQGPGCRRFPCVVVRISARVSREPDNSGIQRPPDRRLGRRRNADPVTDGNLAVVAARR